MSRETKKSKLVKSLVKPGSQYGLVDAVNILSQVASKKFSESVDVAINLGVDPKKPDQMVVGSCVLPNGTGKKVAWALAMLQRLCVPMVLGGAALWLWFGRRAA